MKTMNNFIPDADAAKRSWSRDDFSTYSRAYINTNENLHISMKYIPKNCNRALVVAASGDHPLFCSLYGAKHVDTFDVSYNAKCLTDIKVAALSCLNREEYSDFLDSLRSKDNIAHVIHFEKISKQIPSQEYEYLCKMTGYPVFCRGMLADVLGYDNDKWRALTVAEYQKLQGIVKEPYDFVMTDIRDLSNKLDGCYDFMHLSNIFDYIDKKERFDVLEPLFGHINTGGRIVIQHMGRRNKNVWRISPIPMKKIFSDVFWNWRFIKAENRVSILERIR
jgi:hypothetical protein